MQTTLASEYAQRADALDAKAILGKCVHCGFCTATCPTYQILGDELDGPRGRIYLIKQVLEGQAPTRKTQLHLDRCLTCRNCETTCPSGVQYGHLVDIGRKIVDEKVTRPASERALRWALKEGLPSAAFGPAMKIGQAVRGALPQALKAKVPEPRAAGAWPTATHARKVIMLEGCVQPSMAPSINAATARVLDAMGIEALRVANSGCCGAVRFHLNDHEGGTADMRANIDAWWPLVERGEVEAILVNASGCGIMVKEYGHHLARDAAYAEKACRISDITRDPAEYLAQALPLLQGKLKLPAETMVYHPPCTLQHGQKLKGTVEQGLRALGFDVRVAINETHLCCGSAGTYSVLQPEMATQLRDRKLQALHACAPSDRSWGIASANIGCITHLQSGSAQPARHWVEWLDAAL